MGVDGHDYIPLYKFAKGKKITEGKKSQDPLPGSCSV